MTGGGLKPPRPPPNAVKSGPIAAACAAALAYYTYAIHYSSSRPDTTSSDAKTVPWWKPSN